MYTEILFRIIIKMHGGNTMRVFFVLMQIFSIWYAEREQKVENRFYSAGEFIFSEL
mgnify:CR=1 FL=1